MSETVVSTETKRGKGAPKANHNAETHGHYRRKLKLSSVSFDDLNFSSAGGEQLASRRLELIEHLGGKVSAVERRVIERICFSEYLTDHLDLHLAELGPKIINRRKRTLIPIVLQRDALVNTLTKLYDAIGYTPREKPAPTLHEIQAAIAAKRAHAATAQEKPAMQEETPNG